MRTKELVSRFPALSVLTGDASMAGLCRFAHVKGLLKLAPEQRDEILQADGFNEERWTRADQGWAKYMAQAGKENEAAAFRAQFERSSTPRDDVAGRPKPIPKGYFHRLAAKLPEVERLPPSEPVPQQASPMAPPVAMASYMRQPARSVEADPDETGAVDTRQLAQALMPFSGRVDSITRHEDKADAVVGGRDEADAAGETVGLDIRRLATLATPFEDPLEGTALAVEVPADLKAVPFNTSAQPAIAATSSRQPERDEHDPAGETTGVDLRQLLAAATPFGGAPSSSTGSALPSLHEYVRLGVELGSCPADRVDAILAQARMSRAMWAHVDATYRARIDRDPDLRAQFDEVLAGERARRPNGKL